MNVGNCWERTRGLLWLAMTTMPVAFVVFSTSFAAVADERADQHFATKVWPILSERCLACHGADPDEMEGGLDLSRAEPALAGGDSGQPAWVVRDSEQSPLIQAVSRESNDWSPMPPKENDALSESEIEVLKKWIDDGAVWLEADRRQRFSSAMGEGEVQVATSGGLDSTWTSRSYLEEDIWAFRPLTNPQPPSNQPHPIDAFVDARLKSARLTRAPQATPDELLRRLSFALTGLPPTAEEKTQFLKAWQEDSQLAWESAIEARLQSPRYGERWAQHWLDVVRYADSAGFSNDWELSNAWRYRDYVIRSLNADKPWNRFIIEQLAGDELDPEDPEMTIAVGFLRMGPWEHTPMSPNVETRQLYLDDLVNSTGQAFLSTTMKCAKCHDHKFDPIPTRDYYRLYAAFATTQPAEREAEYLAAENRTNFESNRQHIEELLHFAEQDRDRLYAKREVAAKKWYEERGLPYKDRKTRLSLDEEKPARFEGLSSAEQGVLKVREQDVRIWSRALERFEPLAQSVYNGGDLYQKSQRLRPPNPDNKDEATKAKVVPTSHIYAGGSVYAESESVSPGVLSALGLPADQQVGDDPFRLPDEMAGRRLALARWIARADNPLTLRSIVNRVWHYHFGRGIAPNPNNFGASGARPTHPELLDYLSQQFVKQGWSLKHLHRLILTSETWKMSSSHPEREQQQGIDPDNESLWVFEPRRLSAEELRDSILYVSGELNLEMGGLPVNPEINQEVAFGPRKIQFSLAPVWQPSATARERHRRTIYTRRIRTQADPLLEVFNRPAPDEACELRDSATSSTQVFALMNSDLTVNRTIAMALRLQNERSTLTEQISRGFELAFGRQPKATELTLLQEFFSEMVGYHRQHKASSKDYPTTLTRSLVEELSGDPFEYTELLNRYAKFEPDLGPADVTAETRALADIVSLLLNANEFIFVY